MVTDCFCIFFLLLLILNFNPIKQLHILFDAFVIALIKIILKWLQTVHHLMMKTVAFLTDMWAIHLCSFHLPAYRMFNPHSFLTQSFNETNNSIQSNTIQFSSFFKWNESNCLVIVQFFDFMNQPLWILWQDGFAPRTPMIWMKRVYHYFISFDFDQSKIRQSAIDMTNGH